MPRSNEEIERAVVEAQAWLDSLDPETLPESAVDDRKDLRRIGVALLAIEGADEALVRAVADARSRGRSWTDIAGVLGVSRQAARQRFASRGESGEAQVKPSHIFELPNEQAVLLLPRLNPAPAEQVPPEDSFEPDDIESLMLNLAPHYRVVMSLLLRLLSKEPYVDRQHIAEMLAIMALLDGNDQADDEGSDDRSPAKQTESHDERQPHRIAG